MILQTKSKLDHGIDKTTTDMIQLNTIPFLKASIEVP
jgi:hypothetical protein